MPQPADAPQIRIITSELFEENCYVVWRHGRRDCIVVDPGLEPERIIAEIESLGLTPSAILNTHGHADHIAGNESLKSRWPEAPLAIGVNDADKLTDPAGNLSAGYGLPLFSPPADQTLVHGEVLDLAGLRWQVRDAPGHSRGHIVFVALTESPPLVLGGDVLFAGSVGRTDFPDGDWDALVRSIREQLFTLADDAVILPGHGEPTTVGREKRFNPFVGERALRDS